MVSPCCVLRNNVHPAVPTQNARLCIILVWRLLVVIWTEFMAVVVRHGGKQHLQAFVRVVL